MCVLLDEGAVMRRLDGGARRGARGRETNAPPKLPGGDGAPLGGTMTSRQELADGGPHGSPEARKHGHRKGPWRRAVGRPAGGCQKRGPSPTRRRDGAPKGAASSQKE